MNVIVVSILYSGVMYSFLLGMEYIGSLINVWDLYFVIFLYV